MKSKLQEQSLIWENYMTNSPSRDEDSMEHNNFDYSDSFDDDGDDNSFDNGDDSSFDDAQGVVMSFDTSEPVEVDHEEGHDDENSERDDMIRSELMKLVEFAKRIEDMAKDAEFEEWMAAKITKASDYVSDVYFRLATKADYANCGCGD